MNLEKFIEQFSHTLTNGSFISIINAAPAATKFNNRQPCTLPVGLGIAGLVSNNTEKKTNTGFIIALAFTIRI